MNLIAELRRIAENLPTTDYGVVSEAADRIAQLEAELDVRNAYIGRLETMVPKSSGAPSAPETIADPPIDYVRCLNWPCVLPHRHIGPCTTANRGVK